LKDSFEAEKDALQQQVHMYQAEVDELQQELDRGDNPRKRADSLNKTVVALQREKKLVRFYIIIFVCFFVFFLSDELRNYILQLH